MEPQPWAFLGTSTVCVERKSVSTCLLWSGKNTDSEHDRISGVGGGGGGGDRDDWFQLLWKF